MKLISNNQTFGGLIEAIKTSSIGLNEPAHVPAAEQAWAIGNSLRRFAERLDMKGIVMRALEEAHRILTEKDPVAKALGRDDRSVIGIHRWKCSDAEKRAFNVLVRLLCKPGTPFIVEVSERDVFLIRPRSIMQPDSEADSIRGSEGKYMEGGDWLANRREARRQCRSAR